MAHGFLPQASQWLFHCHSQIKNPELQVHPSQGHLTWLAEVLCLHERKNRASYRSPSGSHPPWVCFLFWLYQGFIWQRVKHGWSRKSSSFLISLSRLCDFGGECLDLHGMSVISSSGLAPAIPCPSFVGVIHQLLFSLCCRGTWATLQDVIWVP